MKLIGNASLNVKRMMLLNTKALYLAMVLLYYHGSVLAETGKHDQIKTLGGSWTDTTPSHWFLLEAFLRDTIVLKKNNAIGISGELPLLVQGIPLNITGDKVS